MRTRRAVDSACIIIAILVDGAGAMNIDKRQPLLEQAKVLENRGRCGRVAFR